MKEIIVKIGFIVLLLSVMSCNSNAYDQPKEEFPEEETIVVLTADELEELNIPDTAVPVSAKRFEEVTGTTITPVTRAGGTLEVKSYYEDFVSGTMYVTMMGYTTYKQISSGKSWKVDETREYNFGVHQGTYSADIYEITGQFIQARAGVEMIENDYTGVHPNDDTQKGYTLTRSGNMYTAKHMKYHIVMTDPNYGYYYILPFFLRNGFLEELRWVYSVVP